ncbi:MAG: ester cyclase [Proteobacteria bacterium]|nr:ester cyclase [Pseudomonadota bacterium]
MSREHLDLIARFYAAFNRHDMDALDELVRPDIVDHNPGPGQPPGLPGLKKSLSDFRVAFPDMVVENQAIVCDGDLAMVRSRCRGTHEGDLLNLPPTGKSVDFDAIDNWRIEGGRLAEIWHVEEVAKLMAQIGAFSLSRR